MNPLRSLTRPLSGHMKPAPSGFSSKQRRRVSVEGIAAPSGL